MIRPNQATGAPALLLFATLACSASCDSPGPRPEPGCDVCIAGRCVPDQEIETMRARFSPPPSRDEAERVLLEARALWIRDGSAGDPTQNQLLGMRRRFLREMQARGGDTWREAAAMELADLMLSVGVQRGESCGLGG